MKQNDKAFIDRVVDFYYSTVDQTDDSVHLEPFFMEEEAKLFKIHPDVRD